MDAEKLKILQLATAYESLSNSPAFRELIQWLDDSVQSTELQAANAGPESKEFFLDYFTLWQQRKKVVNGIKIHVSEFITAKHDLEEEIRTEVAEPEFSTSDTTIRGY